MPAAVGRPQGNYDCIANALCDYGLSWRGEAVDACAYAAGTGRISIYEIGYGDEVRITPSLYRGFGFALMNQIIKDGRRVNMAQAYLYPVLARPNLTVLTRTLADRLVIENGRAAGVEITRNGESRTLRAAREVVLSLGAIRSPKMLMLSGIGDRAHLAEHGIAAKVHAPEVGRNFHDHILHGGCLWEAPRQLTYNNSGANASGFWKSDAALATPDLNIVQIELPYASEVVAREYAPPDTSWALCAGLVAPKSRGSVRLASAKPADAPVVDAQFLAHPDDVKALMKGIDL